MAREEILETEMSAVPLALSYKMVEILPAAAVARLCLARMAELVFLGGLKVVQADRELVSVSRVILSLWAAEEADRAAWRVQVRTVEGKAAVVLTRLAHSRQAEQLEPAAAAAAVLTRSRPIQGFLNSPAMVEPVQ